ncbi:unnamed protein product [Caretta caretta]
MEAEKNQAMAKKETLLNLNAKSEEAAFETTARVFQTADYIAKTNRSLSDHKSLIDLQQINGIEMGRLLHSRTVCVDIINHIATEMKKRIVNKIINNKAKITVLVNESTTLTGNSTLIIFLKAGIDGIMRPLTFPLDLIELQSATAAAIKGEILKCLLCCGFTKELLLEMMISFCSDSANVMLGVKAGVGKLLQMDFPNVILWHCLNHRLELAVDEALEVTGGTNDFKAFLDALYSLYSQSPKNSHELSAPANELHIVLKKKLAKYSI